MEPALFFSLISIYQTKSGLAIVTSILNMLISKYYKNYKNIGGNF